MNARIENKTAKRRTGKGVASAAPTYKPAAWCKIPAVDVPLVGAAIDELNRKLGRAVKEADLLKVARSKRHPLHRFFEWDDAKAADKYRLEQARILIASVDIVYESVGGPRKVRAFCGMRNGQGYVPSVQVFDDEAMSARFVEMAKRDFVSAYHRHQTIRECAGMSQIFDAIEAAFPELQPQAAE